MMQPVRVRPEVERDIAGVQRVVSEVLLDHVSAVAKADNEVGDPSSLVDLQYVPQRRAPADLDHRLRTNLCLLAQSRSEAAGQDHRLHAVTIVISPCVLPCGLESGRQGLGKSELA